MFSSYGGAKLVYDVMSIGPNYNLTALPRNYVNFNGNVGIGTTNPDEKLTVNGTIHAKEVKVTATIPADYVFQKYYTGKSDLKSDYIMPTLVEIEKFTKKITTYLMCLLQKKCNKMEFL